jgi:hypothetical protein
MKGDSGQGDFMDNSNIILQRYLNIILYISTLNLEHIIKVL